MLKNLFGQKLDEVTIKRIKTFEPLGGYYLAFSGGKDSIVLHNLTVRAGVRFESWYNNTTCDPPELIRFIKKHYPQVNWNNPEMSIFTAIVKHGFPLRHRRWCCRIYKESGGRNRTVLVGNRG
jgi:phosphoadenosine phosphosulfate reductase